MDDLGASLLKGFLLSLSKNPVMVGIKEGLLVVGVVRVSFWMKPGVLVGSDGSFETREISDEEDCTPCFLNVGSFWEVGSAPVTGKPLISLISVITLFPL